MSEYTGTAGLATKKYSRMDRPEIFMHITSQRLEHQKILGVIPAACLSFLTLGSLSVYGIPAHYSLTLAASLLAFTLITIMVLWRAKP